MLEDGGGFGGLCFALLSSPAARASRSPLMECKQFLENMEKTCTHYVRVTLICIRSYNNCVSPLNITRNLGFVACLKCVVLGLEPGSWSRAWHWNHTPRGRQICAGFVCLCLLPSKVELSPETNRSQWILLLVLPSDSESGKHVCRKAILGH